MRSAWLAIWLSLTACSSWHSAPITAIHDERAMIFTDRTAYELSRARIEASRVVGVPVHAWHISTCTYDATQSPTDIAQHCRWRVEPTDAAELAIDFDSIRNVHVRRTHNTEIKIVCGALVASVLMFYGALQYAKLAADD